MSRRNRDLPKPARNVAHGIHTAKSFSEGIRLADFTDGGGTAGTYQMQFDIPQDALVLGCRVSVPEAFAGDTSAVITIGDGTDVDRYNTGTPSVFATSAGIDMGEVSGTEFHTADATPVVTVTSASDFGAITGGGLVVTILYI